MIERVEVPIPCPTLFSKKKIYLFIFIIYFFFIFLFLLFYFYCSIFFLFFLYFYNLFFFCLIYWFLFFFNLSFIFIFYFLRITKNTESILSPIFQSFGKNGRIYLFVLNDHIQNAQHLVLRQTYI